MAKKLFPRSSRSGRSVARQLDRASQVAAMVAARRIPRSLKGTPQGEHEFTRTISVTTQYTGLGFILGASNHTALSFVFSPIDVTVYGSAVNYQTVAMINASEFSALFEQARIDKVVAQFCFRNTNGSNNRTNNCPVLMVGTDPNSGGTGSSLNQVMQLADCRPLNAVPDDGIKYMTIRPKFQQQIFYTAATSGYQTGKGFVDSGVSIPHYSMHLASDTWIGEGYLTIVFKYYLTYKGQK